MNYLFETLFKPKENTVYCDLSLLSVQFYSLKLMFDGKTVKDKYEQKEEYGQRYNFYPTVFIPGAILYDVKTFENIGDYNQIRIKYIKFEGDIILNIYRGEYSPEDNDTDFYVHEIETNLKKLKLNE